MKTIAALLLGATLLSTSEAADIWEVWFYGCTMKCVFEAPLTGQPYLNWIDAAYPGSHSVKSVDPMDSSVMIFGTDFGGPYICPNLQDECTSGDYKGKWRKLTV